MTYSSCCGKGYQGSDSVRSSYVLQEQQQGNSPQAYALGPGNGAGYTSGLGGSSGAYRTPECGKYPGVNRF